MAEILNYRRYALHKRKQAQRYGDEAVADVWLHTLQNTTGTPLPSTVPYLTQLAAADYTAVEDLDGADTDELVAAGLSYRQASAVLASL